MEKSNLQISLSYQQIADLVLQLSEEDSQKLRNELKKILSGLKFRVSEEKIRNILQDIKKYFNDKLGKYTHKKSSKDWFFYGLGFSTENLGYVFGFNIGFFYNSEINLYEKIGMNVLIRTDGEQVEIRNQYLNFFRQKLSTWSNTPEKDYFTLERDGKGIEIGRYAEIKSFETEEQILQFLKECVDGIHAIYPDIIYRSDNIFHKVVRAAPPWKEPIIELCKHTAS